MSASPVAAAGPGIRAAVSRARPAPVPSLASEMAPPLWLPAGHFAAALVFWTAGALEPGQSFVLVNDHDPFPLRYQFQAERPGQFGWEYLESGPVVWRVEIARV